MSSNRRINIIDILRGHFLIAMILDHSYGVIGPAIFILYNYNGKLWVSAAEGFVLLSGLMIGYLYVYKQNLSFTEVFKRLRRRTLLLYIVSAILAFTYSQLLWNYSLPQSGVFEQGIKPVWNLLLAKILLLQHHYGWSDILPMYVYFLVITPLIIYLLRKRLDIVVILSSLTLWLLTQTKSIPLLSVSLFSIYSWQILFVAGIFIGKYIEQVMKIGRVIKQKKLLSLLILFFFIIAIFGSIYYPNVNINGYQLFDKGSLAIGRLLLVPLWILASAIILQTVLQKLPTIRKTYELLGKNSLFVYAFQSAVLALATVVFRDNGLLINSVVTFFLFLCIVLVTYLNQKYFLEKKNNVKKEFQEAFNNALGSVDIQEKENFNHKKEYRILLEKKYLPKK